MMQIKDLTAASVTCGKCSVSDISSGKQKHDTICGLTSPRGKVNKSLALKERSQVE